MEQDISILRKVLNGKLFLSKHPMLDRVFVDIYNKRIDIVLSVNDTKRYWKLEKKIKSSIRDIVKILGIETYINIYP